jgi:hypothetical protein
LSRLANLSTPWSILGRPKDDSAPSSGHTTYRARTSGRVFKSVITCFFAICAAALAEEPSLKVYEILPPNYPQGELEELVLKIDNPTGRTYYIYGSTITDVPYVIEIERDGRWVTLPRPGDLVVQKMRPFLPGSYLLLTVYPPLTSSREPQEVKFRVRAFLFKDASVTNPYTDLRQRPFVELVSPVLSTKSFAPRESAGGERKP